MNTAGPHLGEVRVHHVDLPEGRHRYLTWGDERNPPLVLLHGRTGLVETWRGVAQALADRWHVIAFEQRGHGESQWAAPGRYQLGDFVSDYEAFVDQVVGGPHHLLGHSNGSCTALIYAGRHPDLVRALILEDGGPFGKAPIVRDAVAEALAGMPRSFESWTAAREFISGSEFKQGELLDAWTDWSVRPAESGTWVWRSDVHTLLTRGHLRDPLIEEGQWEAVDALRMPTVFLHATEPYLVEADVPDEMARRNPRIEVVRFATGHSIHEERLDQFLEVVGGFLDTHRESGP